VTDERYPIGKFTAPAGNALSAADRGACIDHIAIAPANFRRAFAGLNDAQLDTPYRAGGWTVRQVAHHVPDSHMNAYIRFKLGLTEDAPAIKTYEEKDWAKTPETRAAARNASGRFRAHDQAPRVGNPLARHHPRPVRLARPASHGPRHGAAAALGLG